MLGDGLSLLGDDLRGLCNTRDMTTDCEPGDDHSQTIVDYERLTTEQLATVLSESGDAPVAASDIVESLSSGLPTNPDGTVSLLVFVAWVETQSRRSRRV